jgi:hypothetical protein
MSRTNSRPLSMPVLAVNRGVSLAVNRRRPTQCSVRQHRAQSSASGSAPRNDEPVHRRALARDVSVDSLVTFASRRLEWLATAEGASARHSDSDRPSSPPEHRRVPLERPAVPRGPKTSPMPHRRLRGIALVGHRDGDRDAGP